MLMFLLKSGRLRLPVCLLVLIIGTGLLPEKTGAVTCHKCEGIECMGDLTDKTEDCPDGICEWHVTRDGTATRSCSKAPTAKCYLHLKGGCTSFDDKDPGFTKYQTCAASGGQRQGDERASSRDPTASCFCDTDLCNNGKDPTIVELVPNGGDGPNPPDPNPTTGTGGSGGGTAPAPTGDGDDKKSDNGTATGGPFSSFNTFGVLFFAVLGAFVSAGSVMVRS